MNGRGTLLTTEECLLDQKRQVRNPGFSRADTEAVLRDNLGVKNIVWLGKGIAGDDTHGHVDDLCRFVDRAHRGAGAREKSPRCELQAARRELGTFARRAAGRREQDWMRWRCRCRRRCILMACGCPRAMRIFTFQIQRCWFRPSMIRTIASRSGILGELFPGRAVVGIHAVDLVWGFGTFHCLTQQQPAC